MTTSKLLLAGILGLLVMASVIAVPFFRGTDSGILENEAVWLARYYGADKNATLVSLCGQIEKDQGVRVRIDQWQDLRSNAEGSDKDVFQSLPMRDGRRMVISADQMVVLRVDR